MRLGTYSVYDRQRRIKKDLLSNENELVWTLGLNHPPFKIFTGLEKNLNSCLPFGQVALKFCLPWASLRLLFL